MTTIDESLTAKGFTPAALVPSTFGFARVVKSITIHWWGAYGQTHDGVCAFFCTTGPGATSAHYVVSDGRINCIVNPDDAAWHAGNAEGNATSIGIECRPEATDGDYETIAELIRYLRGIYGDVPLRTHRSWSSTACPGDYDLDRLDALARQTTLSPQGSTITEEEDMPSVEEIAAAVWGFRNPGQDSRDMRQIVADVPVSVWSYANPGLGGGDAYQILRDAVANTDRIAQDVATVAARAAAGGASEDQIKEAVKSAIAESVVNVDVNVGSK